MDNELRHRPALVDPQTRTLRVLPIKNARGGEKICVNGLFEILLGSVSAFQLTNLTFYDSRMYFSVFLRTENPVLHSLGIKHRIAAVVLSVV